VAKSKRTKPAAKRASTPKPAAAKPKPVTVASKKSTRPTIALPPPPPPPPAMRDEMIAPRDVSRLLRYGERFGPHKIDVRMLPLQLPVHGSGLAMFDPGAPKSWRVFDRPIGVGQFRVMLSIAQNDGREELAAIVIHVGRPPISTWTVAHFAGSKKPKSADQLPRCAVTTGWIALMDAGSDGDTPGVIATPAASGITPIECPLTDGRRALALPCGNGDYAAYWAVDAADKPVCLVVDFDVFTQKDWKARAI
jgi:hypothetical protein